MYILIDGYSIVGRIIIRNFACEGRRLVGTGGGERPRLAHSVVHVLLVLIVEAVEVVQRLGVIARRQLGLGGLAEDVGALLRLAVEGEVALSELAELRRDLELVVGMLQRLLVRHEADLGLVARARVVEHSARAHAVVHLLQLRDVRRRLVHGALLRDRVVARDPEISRGRQRGRLLLLGGVERPARTDVRLEELELLDHGLQLRRLLLRENLHEGLAASRRDDVADVQPRQLVRVSSPDLEVRRSLGGRLHRRQQADILGGLVVPTLLREPDALAALLLQARAERSPRLGYL